MRQIKFRIWDNTNKCFVSNTTKINPNADITNCIFRDRIIQGTFLGLVFGYYDKPVIFFFFCNFTIDGYVIHSLAERFIIQEYTGLTDKNNNDIYEGDIVKFDDGEIAEVVFFCGAFMTSLKKGESIKIDYDSKHIWQDGEIIGNIFENKELLE